MSNYADYEDISLSYDNSRKAVGVEIVLGYLNMMQRPMHDLIVLDAGCGTGNYAKIIGPKVKKIVCCDISAGMLEQAKKKVDSVVMNKFDFLQADMGRLSYKNESFDVIMCNQSLHHIEVANGLFENLQQFLYNAHLLLKSKGRIFINTIIHEQLQNGVWWADLIKPAVEHTKKIFPTDLQLADFLNNTGFKVVDKVIPFHCIIQENGYHDPSSIKDAGFRRGDSHFSLLSSEQLESAFLALEKLQNENKIDKYMKKREQLRKSVGQFTCFIAEKE